MSRPRFLADHNLNEHIVAGVLRQEPMIEFVRARDVGLSKSSDHEILEYADFQGLLVVSHDVNTMPAAANQRTSRGDSFSGLLMIQQSLSVGKVIDQLVMIWSASEMAEWKDLIVFLPL